MNHLVGEEPRSPIDCDSLLVKQIEQNAQRINIPSKGHMDHLGQVSFRWVKTFGQCQKVLVYSIPQIKVMVLKC